MSSKKGRGRAGHQEEEHENHERWLISYADMITLLMVFFIVLFSMSVIDASKFKAIAESMAESIGGGQVESPPSSLDNKEGLPKTDPSASASPDASAPADPAKSEEKTPEEIAAELKEAIAQAGLTNSVSVDMDERGVVLLLTNSLLFDSGSATIRTEGRDVLRRLMPIVKARQKPIIVEGHTDPTAISTAQFPSNWELSTTRATNVLRFLLENGIPPDDLTASGYAYTHPRATNATPDGREENRRVEMILVLKPADDPRAAAAAAASD